MPDDPVTDRAEDSADASTFWKLVTPVGVADGLVGDGEVDGCGGLHHQRVVAGAAVNRGFGAVVGDGIVAGAGADDIGAAGAVDRIVTGARRDGIGRGRAGDRDRGRQRRSIDVLEIGDAGGIARGLVDVAEIDRGDGLEHQRVVAGAAVDQVFRPVVGDGIVARAGIDDIGAAAAIDDIVARAGRDNVDAGRSR